MSASRAMKLPRVLYAGEAIDATLERFAAFATFERESDERHFIVTVTPKRAGAAHLRRLCGELGNYALGLSIRRGGAAT